MHVHHQYVIYFLLQVEDILSASSKFVRVSSDFHNSFDTSFTSLELLAYHEYNDQLMELERAFLLPPSTHPTFFVTSSSGQQRTAMSTSTYRHVIHGPSPLDASQIDFLPRLKAALEIAKAAGSESTEAWNVVKREAFFVVDALESAACVLQNHLIDTTEEENSGVTS